MRGAKWVAAMVVAMLVAVGASTNPMTVTVDSKTGDVEIAVGGRTFLHSTEIAVSAQHQWATASNGGLKMVGTGTTFSGGDSTGAYDATQFTFTVAADSSAPRFVATVRVYTDVPAVAFEQYFPDGLNGTSVWDSNKVITSFPSFELTATRADALGYFSFWNTFIQSIHVGQWWNGTLSLPSGLDAGPYGVFDSTLDNTLVVSPLSEFMAGSVYLDTSVTPTMVRNGIMGGVMSIPPGFRYSTVVFHGATGINNAVYDWGSLLLSRYGKPRGGPTFDFTVNNLGYNTDHGSFYYYHTEPGKNYLQTLTDVYTYAEEAGLPYKFVLLDSWWYYKGDRDGVYNWTAMPSVFPGGNKGMQNLTLTTNWHTIAHNRYWADNTNYAKQNGGKWDFVVEPENQLAIPVEEAFWDYIMSTSRKWGLNVYEQDWLYNEFIWMNVTLSNATIARTWLLQMGNAAQHNGVNIQYCMPYPRHAMQSVEIPAVTQIRVSGDYVPGSINQQWQIGGSSILAHALGLAPFKDNFWTTTIQPGNPYNSKELYPELEACVATLSTGPITPSDKIGLTNVDLVLRSISTTGVALQPSRPATQVDATFTLLAFNTPGPLGQLWSTYSDIGYYRWHHIFAAEMLKPYAVTPATLMADMRGTSGDHAMVAYSVDAITFDISTLTIASFSADQPIDIPVCNRSDFKLFHVAKQYSSGWALLGELGKWVPVSPARFRSVNQDPSEISALIAGKPGEVVHVSFANPQLKLVTIDATIQPNGRAVVTQPTSATGLGSVAQL